MPAARQRGKLVATFSSGRFFVYFSAIVLNKVQYSAGDEPYANSAVCNFYHVHLRCRHSSDENAGSPECSQY
jgi:hypothetical protein